MRIWHNRGTAFEGTEVSVTPHPGFMTDFQPLAVLFDCFTQGENIVVENPLATNIGYIQELNKHGAKIEIERNLDSIQIKIAGPTAFKSGKINVNDLRYALVSLLFALSVEGQNELAGFDIIENGFDDIVEKIKSIGGRIVE